MLDKQTEERIKMMTQDYEWQTRGIPNRLDQVLYDGYTKGLANAERQQARFDAQTKEIVEATKKNIRNATYEQLKQNYKDYTKLYNRAVRSLRNRIAFVRLLVWLFGLGSLGSAALGIGSCFFDSADAVPELIKPFYDSAGMLGMILFVAFGVIWWILYAIYSNRGDPEYSGMAGRYLDILDVIERKLQSKKFVKQFKSDPYFRDLNEDEEDDDDEEDEELYEDELGNYYADDDPENPKNQKVDKRLSKDKYGFDSNDTNLDKAIKIKEYCEENNALFSTALLQRELKVGYSIAKNLKESAEDEGLED